jgi:hypothetical protein
MLTKGGALTGLLRVGRLLLDIIFSLEKYMIVLNEASKSHIEKVTM